MQNGISVKRREETSNDVKSFCPSGNVTGYECIGEAFSRYCMGET